MSGAEGNANSLGRVSFVFFGVLWCYLFSLFLFCYCSLSFENGGNSCVYFLSFVIFYVLLFLCFGFKSIYLAFLFSLLSFVIVLALLLLYIC